MKRPTILFFTASALPTQEEFEKARAINGEVRFRNAAAVKGSESIEKCDGVAGKVPENYAKAFPAAEEAIAKLAQDEKSVSEVVGGQAKPATKAKDSKASDQGHSKD